MISLVDIWKLMIGLSIFLQARQPENEWMNYPYEEGINKTECNFTQPESLTKVECCNLFKIALAGIDAGINKSISTAMFSDDLITLKPPYYFVCGSCAYTWLPENSYGTCTIATWYC